MALAGTGQSQMVVILERTLGRRQRPWSSETTPPLSRTLTCAARADGPA
jgi:hypothetical protein